MKSAAVFLVVVVGIITATLVYAFYVKLDIAVFLATAISALAYVFFTYWDEYVASPRLTNHFLNTSSMIGFFLWDINRG